MNQLTLDPNSPDAAPVRSLATWTHMIHENAVQHGWWLEQRPLLETLMLVVAELVEAAEEYRNHRDMNEVYVLDGKPEGIPIELADAVIRILDLCGAEGIDIEAAMVSKHAYNLTRPFRHGKRV